MSREENNYPLDPSSGDPAPSPPPKPTPPPRRVIKRSSNACERCRRQKVRCSGSRPCDACRKRNLTCTFNVDDQKIMVTRRYIEELQRGAAAATAFEGPAEDAEPQTPSSATRDSHEPYRRHRGRPSTSTTAGQAASTSSNQRPDYHDGPSPFPSGVTDDGQARPYTPASDSDDQQITNPLSASRSVFTTAGNGFTFYMGTSSNWSFTRRILNMTHERLFQLPPSTDDLGFDGMIYDLDWTESAVASSTPTSPVLPAIDYCLHMINAVKFHCCQVFHLFDEDSFMPSLYALYDNPLQQPEPSEELWYVHFLLLMAFGKAFTTKKSQGKRPPGEEYFTKALRLLPNMMMLWTRPIEAIEILSCVALYLHCIDIRIVAHNYIGQAMRLALGSGLHTDMGTGRFGEALVERARRAWWTVYILDREMTSLMGLPQSHHDNGVCPQLPTFLGSVQRTSALRIRIKTSRIMAKINDTVYGADGQRDRKFLHGAKAALSDIAEVADELRHSFPVEREKPGHGVSRISAHLHLLYHQCIILATRPLLYFFLEIRLTSASECLRRINTSETVRNLIRMCLDSSLQSITMLRLLQTQGLLEVFLPFDLDSLFVSTVSAMVAYVLDVHLNENVPLWLQKAYSIFEELVSFGNQAALSRKSELVQLHGLLNSLPPDGSSILAGAHSEGISSVVGDGVVSIDDIRNNVGLATTLLPPIADAVDPCGSDISFENLMTTAELTEMANSIDNLDAEWVFQTILD
ncbi:putative transcription fungi [Rosellinia necatrix]|uniref:Putative transcription fungi n=1 Tax=Rosellinia necatrix TaxID=77044 RepID=A0A1W2TUI1_ROSNE|nr:putative transcription fungi [Rosellinia necatrix]